MNPKSKGRLVILSGPSCIGKSPLKKALSRFYPDLHERLQAPVLHNSRRPRPGERDGVDYHFREREEIEALRSDSRFAVMDVRGDLQAVDLQELKALLAQGDAFFEGNPFVGRLLLTNENLGEIDRLGIFVSPLSQEEIRFLKSKTPLADLVTEVMRRKLLRRTRRQRGELSLPDLEEIERRARSAYGELKEAWRFDYVIPNHDGEDSENWDAFYYPLGDARKALVAVADLLQGKDTPLAEKWEPDLLP